MRILPNFMVVKAGEWMYNGIAKIDMIDKIDKNYCSKIIAIF